jgi:hypothetical protein
MLISDIVKTGLYKGIGVVLRLAKVVIYEELLFIKCYVMPYFHYRHYFTKARFGKIMPCSLDCRWQNMME